MSTGEQTKTCPACAEEIKAAAKICPHCRTKQVRFALWRQEALLALMVLLLLGEWIVVVVLLGPAAELNGRSFAGHQSDLRVGKVAVVEVVGTNALQVAGIVTNVGKYPWRVRELEVRFLGRSGEMIDVQHHELEQPFVVQPGHEGAFRVPLSQRNPDAAGATLQARVQDARDGNEPNAD